MAYRQSTHGAYSLDKIGIKLLVPRAEEGGGDIQPLAVQRELQHLWATMHPLALNKEWFWLLCQLLVLCHLHSISLTDTASQEYLQTERGKELFKTKSCKANHYLKRFQSIYFYIYPDLTRLMCVCACTT